MMNAYFKYILSLLIFGSNGIVASYILLSSTEIVLSRTLIGSLFLLAIFILRREKPRFEEIKRQWFYLLGSGVSMGLSWMFLFEAYRLIGVSAATLAYYCGPVLVMAAAPFLFQERITKSKVAGIVAVVIWYGSREQISFFNRRCILGTYGWNHVCGTLCNHDPFK